MTAKEAQEITAKTKSKKESDQTQLYINELELYIKEEAAKGNSSYTWTRQFWTLYREEMDLVVDYFKNQGYNCTVTEKEEHSSIDTLEVLELIIDWKEIK